MKIFITGSNGFIGSHVVKRALDGGHEVVGLRRSTKRAAIELLKQPKWVEGSLEDDLRPVLQGCDAVIHLAAYGVNPAYNSWQEAFRWNVDATIKVLEQAKSMGVKRFVIAGSCSEYGRSAERFDYVPCDAPLEPVGPYAASKAAATLAAAAYARENDIELVVLRLFHIYGEGESEERFWPSLKRAALAGDDFPMTLGAQIRDFTPVALAAERLLYSAVEQEVVKRRPEIHNLGQGRPVSLSAFAEAQWTKFSATGKLKKGALPYRDSEVMRYVPQV